MGAAFTYFGLVPVTSAASNLQSVQPKTADRLSDTAERLDPEPASTSIPPSIASAPTIGDASQTTVCIRNLLPGLENICWGAAVSIDPELIGIDAAKGAVLITNFHVLDSLASFPVHLSGEGEMLQAQWIAQSRERDLAILFVPDADFPVIPLAEASPPPGTPARASGFPDRNPLTVRDTILLGRTDTCLSIPPCLAMTQGTIYRGDSGGALEANGKLIGINEGEVDDEIAIPIEQVHDFLSEVSQQISQSGIQPIPPRSQGFLGG